MALAVLEAIASVLLLSAALLVPAGDLTWPMAWAFLLVFSAFALVALLVLSNSLLAERSRLLAQGEPGDVLLSIAFGLLLYPGTLIACGLDHRFGASRAVPAWVQVSALGVFVAGYAFSLSAMRANPFFATVVRIQSERGHRVVERGPYAWVRHPGYAGAMLAHLALPLSLGTLWGCAPAVLGCLLLAARIVREEQTLRRGLTGYTEYASRVRWRLLPGVW
jgi:protein-S-isoprenylcysteine O-methyltransferase Ste14